MALAYAQYPGNGSNRNFNVTFPYISRDHVEVKVNGNVVAFTWLTATTIQLATAPAQNSIVDVRRVTPRSKLLVDFQDASTLVETDLDLSALQVFYMAQEAFDLGEASLGVTEDGSFSAMNRRISNVLDPVEAMDVANKRFVENGMTSQLNLATQRATAAKTSETNAKASETAAATSRTNAANSATASASSASASLNSQNAAKTSETNSKASEVAAKTSETNANSHRTAAANSAAAAAKSAQDAAIFDPSSYYTKVQIDSYKFNLANATGALPNARFSGAYDGFTFTTTSGRVTGSNWNTAFTVEGPSPSVFFKQTDVSMNAYVGINGTTFYVLADPDGDGVYNGTYPLEVSMTSPSMKVFGEEVFHAGNTNISAIAAAEAAKVKPRVYRSGAVAFTTVSATTFTHGLGGAPDVVELEFVCKVASDGYAVGAVITAVAGGNGSAGFALESTSTTTIVHIAQRVALVQKTNSIEWVNVSNWNMRIKAVRFL